MALSAIYSLTPPIEFIKNWIQSDLIKKSLSFILSVYICKMKLVRQINKAPENMTTRVLSRVFSSGKFQRFLELQVGREIWYGPLIDPD